jgi:hypothetical protein
MKNLARLTLFAASLTFAFALAALPNTAFAQGNIDNYRDGMPDLIDYSDRWLDEAQVFVGSIASKPELACSPEFASFVFRGRSIAADFVGSAWDAPAMLEEAHALSAAGLVQAVDGAALVGSSCDGSALDEGRTQLGEGRHAFEMKSTAVRHFLKPVFISHIAQPGLPIIGPLPFGGEIIDAALEISNN